MKKNYGDKTEKDILNSIPKEILDKIEELGIKKEVLHEIYTTCLSTIADREFEDPEGDREWANWLSGDMSRSEVSFQNMDLELLYSPSDFYFTKDHKWYPDIKAHEAREGRIKRLTIAQDILKDWKPTDDDLELMYYHYCTDKRK